MDSVCQAAPLDAVSVLRCPGRRPAASSASYSRSAKKTRHFAAWDSSVSSAASASSCW